MQKYDLKQTDGDLSQQELELAKRNDDDDEEHTKYLISKTDPYELDNYIHNSNTDSRKISLNS